VKRLTDILLSALALLLLSPLLLLIAAWIALESGLPVFFIQTRIGLGGRQFRMFKFRSMRRDAAAIGPYFTQRDDPRITRVGRFIRRTSIDELPQIINVLGGDMSLVGPRPDVPAQQQLYRADDWAQRCSVKPGITGLAQVNGRSESTFEQRLRLDLDYAARPSWWLDVRIMWWTLRLLGGKHSN
jgi:lipopolysaccharide/colanic/teichoic acid biosynthesis glycosyltransferase